MGRALVIVGIVIAAALVVCALVVLVRRLLEGPSVRRRDLAVIRERLQHALVALDQVDDAASNWHEVDSPLAAELNQIIREHKQKERNLL